MEIRKLDGRYWGYAYVRVHSEKKVQARLMSMGIPQFLPTVPKARIHHSTKIISHVPMIAGYVFLCASDWERSEVKAKESRIVTVELLRNEFQENVFIEELNAMKRCEQLALEAPVLVNPDIVTGDEVEITSGPLKGLKTTVVSRDNEHDVIIVNISILNKHIEYQVSAEVLKKITA